MKQKLILESKNLTSQEKEAYEARIKNVEAMYDEAMNEESLESFDNINDEENNN